MKIDDAMIERAARAMCVERFGDPDSKEPGGYTKPYSARVISDRNWRCDGRHGNAGDTYREPWSYLWRSYTRESYMVLKAAVGKL